MRWGYSFYFKPFQPIYQVIIGPCYNTLLHIRVYFLSLKIPSLFVDYFWKQNVSQISYQSSFQNLVNITLLLNVTVVGMLVSQKIQVCCQNKFQVGNNFLYQLFSQRNVLVSQHWSIYLNTGSGVCPEAFVSGAGATILSPALQLQAPLFLSRSSCMC